MTRPDQHNDGDDRATSQERLGGLSPRIAPLPGSLQWEWRTCGKARCRCGPRDLHGPSAYHYWYEHGRRRKAYVSRQQLPTVAAALAAHRALHPPLWTMRQQVAALWRLEQEATP